VSFVSVHFAEGMYVGGDYIFNMFNFAGLNISMVGAFYYAYVNFTDDNGSSGKQKSVGDKTPIKKKSELKE
jgi:hypothetical protein